MEYDTKIVIIRESLTKIREFKDAGKSEEEALDYLFPNNDVDINLFSILLFFFIL